MITRSGRIDARIAGHEWRVKAFQRSLLAWFRVEGRKFPWRRRSASRYEVVVSEILLQRTRAETVAKFVGPFLARFAGWGHLAKAREEELRVFLAPIGLWRRRAASLCALGQEMQARKGRFPGSRADIEKLPGVGQYIASAVLLFCRGSREPLLDVNMARVLERCFAARKLADIRFDPWLQALARRVVNHNQAIEMNWAILDLASKVCSFTSPDCAACPVYDCCRYANAPGSARTRATNDMRVIGTGSVPS